MQSLVMDVRDAYIFPNASAIVYDFHPYGTLLDLSNFYKRDSMEMGGLLVTYFAIQLGRVLEQVHALGIIHADVKPDNLMIMAPVLSEKASLDELLARPAIKLIDWGRAIDMNHFAGQEFYGRAGTNAFDCIEMIVSFDIAMHFFICQRQK
jgi:checkpoint serine/threonine-protein kinase